MNIITVGSHVGSFTAKIGPAGKRNRAARRRLARIEAYRSARRQTVIPQAEEVLDLSVTWDEKIARKALELFSKSGQSQRAFATEHSFPESRIRSWKKKFEQAQSV